MVVAVLRPFHAYRHALAELDGGSRFRWRGKVPSVHEPGVGIVVEHARHAAFYDLAQVFDTGDFGQVWHALAPFLKYSAAW